jgi:tetratricopeptide (TPR) repeat protein
MLYSNNLAAQQNDNIQLALKFYQDKDFEKASVLFEELYKDAGYKYYRDYYIRCLFELRDLNTIEKFIKREFKKNPSDYYLKIDLGMVYFNQNKTKDANAEFEEVIENVKLSRNNTISAANAFLSYQQYEYAKKTYKIAAKTQNTDYNMELGNVYHMQRDYSSMMQCYIDFLEKNPEALKQLQSRLQYILSYDIDQNVNVIIERILIERIQKNPQNAELSQLLIWQYTQTGRYRLALRQLYATNKRIENNDVDILEYGILLANNNEFDLALEAFQYLINKGKEHRTYINAYVEYLNTLYTKTTLTLNPNKNDLIKIETMLSEAIEMVLRKDSYKLIYALADIQAFYLDKYDDAINLITKSIGENRFSKSEELNIKLLLGDIYFLNSNQWDATLSYAQVEKEAAQNPIGHEARFRKAKLAYYTGQFEWAQAQLNILKSSTSKLIANDALELSILISENYNLDTITTTMQIYARADFYIFSKQYNKALVCLDSILNLYPNHNLTDDALYRKANIYEAVNNLEKASELYARVFNEFHYDILVDNALFRYANIQEKMKNYDLAEDAYFKLISNHKSSIFVVDARKNLRSLTQNKPNKDDSTNDTQSDEKFWQNEQ